MLDNIPAAWTIRRLKLDSSPGFENDGTPNSQSKHHYFPIQFAIHGRISIAIHRNLGTLMYLDPQLTKEVINTYKYKRIEIMRDIPICTGHK